ncbi:MAG: IclR family transcriptional regulator [Acidimicrobiia bacterium]
MRSVHNTLRVFEVIANRQPVGLADVARRVPLPTTTAHRAISTLVDAGWVEPARDGTKRFEVAAHVIGLVNHGEHPLRSVAAPVCIELRDRCGESVTLAAPDGDEVVVIGHWEGTGVLRVIQAVGTRAPLAVASTGRAFLAHTDEQTRAAVIGSASTAFTDATTTDPAALAEEIELVRRRGWAVVDREWMDGVTQIGAAILRAGVPVGGVGIALPASRFDAEVGDRLGAQVRAAADAIAARLPIAPVAAGPRSAR